MEYLESFKHFKDSKVVDMVTGGDKRVKRIIKLQPKLVNLKDENGVPILSLALDYHDNNHRDISMYLIKKGADIEIESPIGGGTPILWATYKENKDAVVELIKRGAQIDKVDKQGRNVFDLDERYTGDVIYANRIDYKIWETEEVQEAVIKYQPHMFDFIINNTNVHPNIEKKYPELVDANKYNL